MADEQQAFRRALESGDKAAIDHAVVYYPRTLEILKESAEIARLTKLITDHNEKCETVCKEMGEVVPCGPGQCVDCPKRRWLIDIEGGKPGEGG